MPLKPNRLDEGTGLLEMQKYAKPKTPPQKFYYVEWMSEVSRKTHSEVNGEF